jgi:hypothetical protein
MAQPLAGAKRRHGSGVAGEFDGVLPVRPGGWGDLPRL